MSTDIDINTLGSLTLVGEGGEGDVFRCSAHKGLVFKQFKDSIAHELNEAGLSATIGLLSSVDQISRTRLQQRTMWPKLIVRKSGRMVGYLMPELPVEVRCKHGRKEAMRDGLCDWNKLTLRNTWMNNPILNSTVTRFADEKRDHAQLVGLLKDLAETFVVLHQNHIIAGDVSGRNILWYSSASGAVALLIDCDGFRKVGFQAVTIPKESPDWRDPALTQETSIESDLFKLGLAIYRAYYSDGLGFPGTGDRSVNTTRSEVLDLAKRSVAPTGRPTAQDWVALLSEIRGDRLRRPWLRAKKPAANPVTPTSSRAVKPFSGGHSQVSPSADPTTSTSTSDCSSSTGGTGRPSVEFHKDSI